MEENILDNIIDINKYDYLLSYYTSKMMNPLVDELTEALVARLSPNKTYKPNKRQMDITVRCFICNCIRASKRGCDQLFVGLHPKYYKTIVNGKIQGSPVSYNYTRSLFDSLSDLGVIKVVRGGVLTWYFNDDGKPKPDQTTQSYIQLSEWFVDKLRQYYPYEKTLGGRSSLILRDQDKQDIEYTQTRETNKLVRSLDNTNQVLLNNSVCYEGVRLHLQIRRVFNVQWDKGGRFYFDRGMVQNMNAEERGKLEINGESVVEMDYKALHPAICYQRENLLFEEGFDPYLPKIELYKKYDNVQLRAFGKLGLMMLFNAGGFTNAVKALSNELSEDIKKGDFNFDDLYRKGDPFPCKKFMEELLLHNEEIHLYFNTLCGQDLQYADSQIAEYVIRHFTNKDEVCLCIHDSFIVRESLSEELELIMHQAYEEVLGNRDNCIVEIK